MTKPAGESLEYMRDKRRKLLEELHSDEHSEQTPTLAFGTHDPLSVPLVVCDACGAQGQMQKVEGSKGARWVVRCRQCDKVSGQNRKRPWQAALDWNGRNLGSHRYQDLPLFGLARLNPEEAGERLKGIRRNLEIRTNLAGVERNIAQREGSRPPGKEYQERLEAYLAWVMVAQRLVKNQRD